MLFKSIHWILFRLGWWKRVSFQVLAGCDLFHMLSHCFQNLFCIFCQGSFIASHVLFSSNESFLPTEFYWGMLAQAISVSDTDSSFPHFQDIYNFKTSYKNSCCIQLMLIFVFINWSSSSSGCSCGILKFVHWDVCTEAVSVSQRRISVCH